MKDKNRLSPEEKESILRIIRKTAERYRETNRILDIILPDFPEDKHK